MKQLIEYRTPDMELPKPLIETRLLVQGNEVFLQVQDSINKAKWWNVLYLTNDGYLRRNTCLGKTSGLRIDPSSSTIEEK